MSRVGIVTNRTIPTRIVPKSVQYFVIVVENQTPQLQSATIRETNEGGMLLWSLHASKM